MNFKNYSKTTGHIQVALAMCLVGSSIPVGKVISSEIPVFLASFLRFSIAALLIIPLHYRIIGPLKLPTLRVSMLLCVQALLGVFLFSIFLLLGLQYTAAVNAGVILGMLPAVNALLSILILREKLNWRYSIGIFLSVLGAVLLEVRSVSCGGFSIGWIGMLLIIAAVFCESAFSVVGKISGLSLSAFTISCWVTLIGFISFMPFAVYEFISFNYRSISGMTWLLLIYYGSVVTVLGFILFYAGLSKISSMAAGVYMAFAPLSAMVIAVSLLEEAFHMTDAFSALLILLAVLVIGTRTNRTAQ
ncbi:DMT family transporter [Xenorhabdus doucetiae]|uniref:Threonine/homoserine exporter RhtA n=1 Tax=Xenorhabdus doucetiae TaxID=351671 RepID=A0A068QP06_9GAMM|nr:DMT family transporter [Xenorhabdus doucetiae]TYP06297.1 EamA-like transporter family protein [Xenorhabdus doucetiae]CDG16341.1 conserved membrane protein of unknown function [Xenorhabdus doucetiae]